MWGLGQSTSQIAGVGIFPHVDKNKLKYAYKLFLTFQRLSLSQFKNKYFIQRLSVKHFNMDEMIEYRPLRATQHKHNVVCSRCKKLPRSELVAVDSEEIWFI